MPAPNFRGGAYSKFSGGVPAPNFGGGGGGCLLQIFGGGLPAPNFWGGACSKFSGGVPAPNFWGGPPIFRIRSPFGRYASYWNAFLFDTCINHSGRIRMYQHNYDDYKHSFYGFCVCRCILNMSWSSGGQCTYNLSLPNKYRQVKIFVNM